MSYFWTPTAVPTLLAGLLGDVQAALAAAEVAGTGRGAVGRAVVLPGVDVAWDECDCGQLSVIHRRTYRSRNFPADALDTYTKCVDYSLVFDLSMTLVRCVAGLSTNGVPPAPVSTLADVGWQEADAYVLWTTVDCALSELQDQSLVASYLLNQATTLGPQGQCGGTQLDFKIALYPPCPCQPPV